MEWKQEDLRSRLTKESSEFRDLKEQHRGFETRLIELQQKSFLNDEERTEEKLLKKRKLALKDRMEEIVRRHQTKVEGFRAEN